MNPQYPYLIDRMQSTFIDMILILLASFAISNLLDKFDEVPDWVRIVLFFGLWALYEPLMTTAGGTIGNRLKGIRVRQQSHPLLKISFPQAFIRYFIKACLGWLSFITINTNREKRAIHDYVSGSVMIKLPNDR